MGYPEPVEFREGSGSRGEGSGIHAKEDPEGNGVICIGGGGTGIPGKGFFYGRKATKSKSTPEA